MGSGEAGDGDDAEDIMIVGVGEAADGGDNVEHEVAIVTRLKTIATNQTNNLFVRQPLRVKALLPPKNSLVSHLKPDS